MAGFLDQGGWRGGPGRLVGQFRDFGFFTDFRAPHPSALRPGPLGASPGASAEAPAKKLEPRGYFKRGGGPRICPYKGFP